MDGKLFLLDKATPPPSTCFNFDLQRFDGNTWKLTQNDTKLKLELDGTTYTDTPEKIIATAVAGSGDQPKLADGDTIQLDGDIDDTTRTAFSRGLTFNSGIALTLDLNGHSIKRGGSSSTASSSDKDKQYSAIVIGSLESATVDGKSYTYAATVKGNKLTIIGNGNIESGGGNGIWIFGPQANATDLTNHNEYSQLIVGTAGGKDQINITSTDRRGIAGNGTANYSDITINTTGTIKGKKAGIYNPQVGKLTINRGTIQGTDIGTAIEIRAGELEVNGGTIEGSSTAASSSTPHSSGTTSTGAGIAVVQHNTQKAIKVTVNDGDISGYTALWVGNPQNCGEFNAPTEDKEDNTNESLTDYYGEKAESGTGRVVGTVTVDVKGGTLTSNGTGKAKVSSSGTTCSLEGKNAVVNFDKRTTINLSGTEVDGYIAADLTGRTGDNKTGYAIGSGNTFKTFTYDESKSLLAYYTAEYAVPDFNIAVLAQDNGWIKRAEAENTWDYTVTDNETTKVIATFAPNSESTEILKLTTADSSTNTVNLDLSEALFSDLFGDKSQYKTIDASAVTNAGLAFNITGNDKITSILGGAGSDTLTAGAAGTSLNGSAGNDSLVGGDGKDNFIYTAGKDSIEGYTSSDVVSLGAEAGTAPIDFNKLSYDGNDFIVSLGSAEQVLTFINTPEFTIGNVNYKGNSNGVEHIAQGTGISLGAGYTSKTFDGSSLAYTTIDAKEVTTAGGIKITGNDNASSLFGAKNGGELKGGYAGDSLQATGGSTTLNGDYGDDLLIGASGGKGSDLFVYSAGKDSIQNYGESDLVSVKGLNPADAAYSVGTAGNISLDFGGGDLLVFENVIDSGVSLKGSGGNYIYTKDYYAINDKSVTLASTYNNTEEGVNTFDASKTNYETINAAAVNSAISVIGNSLNNKIFGSKAGGTLNGGDGDDTFDLSERTTTSGGVSYVFQYTAGKDVIDGFVEDKDKLDINNTTEITAAKASGDKLAFTFSSKSDVLTFKADNDIEKVDLQNGGYLTKDGVVSDTSFNLFASAKGTIDLTDTPYKDTGINVVNATAAKNQSVTLVGGTQGGAFTFAENKKKDLFEYSGGNVTISGYEAGKDRINLGNASIKSFELAGTNNSDVVLTLDNDEAMSIAGAAGHEVLIHDANSRNNSYAKTVFYANGVLHNKEKRPTIATISAGASDYEAGNSIKKVYVIGGVSEIAITAGNNKTTLDASEGGGVSLYGGAKNDKLIGSTAKADTFIYSAGKDVIENYTAGEQISLTGSGLDIEDAKITLSKSSLKFKFSTKNTLTLKDSDLSTIKVDGTNYTFSKNAIGDGNGNVNLTSQFSGTYKIDTEDAGKITAVDGSAVKKNLTFKGTTEAETFTGGQKKTTFKGGGGNDTFIGNDTGKDIFFYAKGDTGDVTIQNFGTNDKLKIASGTISDISTVSGGVQFTMKKSKTDTAKAGTFKVETPNPNEVLIKANNTYYWFADSTTAGKTDGVSIGDLITADTKVTKSQANTTGYAILDLGYSTNLTKSTVAVKAGEFTFSEGSISKK